jgi:hypothetical protein
MSSPTPGGSNPRMPRQPGVPELVVDPIIPGLRNKKPKAPKLKPKLPGAEKPYPMPSIKDDKVYIQPFPGPSPYSPIKNTKQVNRVYKTY